MWGRSPEPSHEPSGFACGQCPLPCYRGESRVMGGVIVTHSARHVLRFVVCEVFYLNRFWTFLTMMSSRHSRPLVFPLPLWDTEVGVCHRSLQDHPLAGCLVQLPSPHPSPRHTVLQSPPSCPPFVFLKSVHSRQLLEVWSHSLCFSPVPSLFKGVAHGCAVLRAWRLTRIQSHSVGFCFC